MSGYLGPGFWNLRGAVDEVLAAGSQYADGDYANPFALLHTPRLSDLPESLPSPPSDSPTAPPDADSPPAPEMMTIAYDPDEVSEILEEHHPVLAQFWATRGRITRAPVSGRTRTDGGTTVGAGSGSSYADWSKASSPHAVDVYDSRAYESVWVQVPDDWSSCRVALLIMDLASGGARSENTSDLAGQFDRFIEARLADAKALSDEPGEEAEAPADPYADLKRDLACEVARRRRTIPKTFLEMSRPYDPPREKVLRGIDMLNPDASSSGIAHASSLLGAYLIDVGGGRWWSGLLPPGALAGPSGTGPCVGLILVPPQDRSELPTYEGLGLPRGHDLRTYVFHFYPNDDVIAGLRRADALLRVGTAFGEMRRGLPGYTAVLCGGGNYPGGRSNLERVIETLRSLFIPISGYVPTIAMYVDHQGKIFDGLPKRHKPEDGYRKKWYID